MMSKPRNKTGQYLKTEYPKTERMRLTKEEKEMIIAFRAGTIKIQKIDLWDRIYTKALEIATENQKTGRYATIDYIMAVSLKTEELIPFFTREELHTIVELREAAWEADRTSQTAKFFYSIWPKNHP